MHYEFDILELSHAADDERPHRDPGWHAFSAAMEAHSRDGWELVDVEVGVSTIRNKYDRQQKVRTLVSVWKRPVVDDGADGPQEFELDDEPETSGGFG